MNGSDCGVRTGEYVVYRASFPGIGDRVVRATLELGIDAARRVTFTFKLDLGGSNQLLTLVERE